MIAAFWPTETSEQILIVVLLILLLLVLRLGHD